MAVENLTAQRLREVLIYAPDTGVFTWRIARPKCRPGAATGHQQPGRYYLIKIDRVRYYAHRLAWLYMTGAWPAEQIDHKNLDKGDNRWDNLREATQKQNCENLTPRRGTISGSTGISWHARDNLWRARITHHRLEITLGYFKSKEAAIACRLEAEIRLFTHSAVCTPQA